MNRNDVRAAAPRILTMAGCALLASGLLHAQRGGGDWMTAGNDAQRSSWVRGDGKISLETMSKPGFELVWKYKMPAGITSPVLLDFYIGYRGFRALGFFGTPEKIVALDIDLARLEWEKAVAGGGRGSDPCPGGMTAGVTRPTVSQYPPAFAARGAGRSSGAKSGVGEPNEGAVTLKDRPVPFAFPPAAGPNRRTAPPPNPFGRTPQYLAAITPDGKLHLMYVSNGDEPNPAIDFLPAGANAKGLIVFDNTAYVTTTNGCGGVDNGVWALNLQSKQVSKWKAPGNIAGALGAAAAPEGILYVAAGSELVALEAGSLKQKDAFKGSVPFSSSPVVFEHKGKDLVAVASSDGQLHLFAAESLGRPVDSTASGAGSGFAPGSLASWQDGGGVRWLMAVAGGKVSTWKVVEKNGGPGLEAGWQSRALVSPLAPLVINGVVFAASGGNASSNAVLYALDAATGRELWNSGSTIASATTRGAGLAAGGGRVYIAGADGTQYAFGFFMEH